MGGGIKLTSPNIKPGKSFMEKLFVTAKESARTDALKGIMQDKQGSSGLQYFSQQYKKYKLNYMNKFTRNLKSGKTKKQTNSPAGGFKKLKSVRGMSIVNNDISQVNMTLTGQMWNGLGLKDSGSDYFVAAFQPKDTGKISGNRVLGREVVGLNDKNIEKLGNIITEQLNKNVENWAKVKVIINI